MLHHKNIWKLDIHEYTFNIKELGAQVSNSVVILFDFQLTPSHSGGSLYPSSRLDESVRPR